MQSSKVKRTLPNETASREDVIKYGKDLKHYKQVEIKICGVNNGYSVTIDNNYYVFTNPQDVTEFISSAIPLKGTDKNFLDALDEKPVPPKNEELPF